MEILLHFVVREPQKGDPISFNLLLTSTILFLFPLMGCAVNLDSQHESRAKEIYYVLIDWFLSMEVVTQHLCSLKGVPQENLRQCHLLSERTSCGLQIGFIW